MQTNRGLVLDDHEGKAVFPSAGTTESNVVPVAISDEGAYFNNVDLTGDEVTKSEKEKQEQNGVEARLVNTYMPAVYCKMV